MTDIPDAAHKRLAPYVDACLRRLTAEQRQRIEAGVLLTKVVTDGTNSVVVVQVMDENGLHEIMRIAPESIGLSIDLARGDITYIPGDDE